MEYYSVIKRNGILPFATTWVDLEGTTLSEVSETEKDKHCMISYVEFLQTQAHRHREQICVCQRWGVGAGKWVKGLKRHKYKLPVIK